MPDRVCFCHLNGHRGTCTCHCPEGWPTIPWEKPSDVRRYQAFNEEVIAVILEVPDDHDD